jgi:hypothetical protein
MPNRVLRDWTNSERLDKLSVDAEIFFTRLIMKADDFGGFYGNTKLLKSHLFPLKEFSHSKIEPWILECAEIGVLNYYQVDGKKYVRINDFGQRTRIMKSKFPEPTDEQLTNDGQLTDIRPLETKPIRNQSETESETKPKLLVQLSDESGLNENEKIAFAFWKLFKKNILESGISKTATLDRAKLCLWTNNIRLIIDLDGRTHDELTNVWNYLNSDDSAFWKKNILSTATLREKFERLYMEAKEKQYKSTGKISTEYLQKLHQRLYGN